MSAEMTWPERIPGAIAKAEGLLPTYVVDQAQFPDGSLILLTPTEVALAKALFPYWDYGEGTDVYWENANAALRAFVEKVEAL